MNKRDPKLTALKFNECINRQDLDGLARLMSDDHTFVDSGGDAVTGKEQMRAAWRGFFKAYPDYKNIFDRVEWRQNLVVMLGRSTCSNEKALDGPGIWTAVVENDLVAEWRVYDDTDENRKTLNTI